MQVRSPHPATFEDGRSRTRRGGCEAANCGARTRGGGPCRQAPLKGHLRCLRHAGPKAAREFRERQVEAVRRGKLAWSEFQRHEERRARNRLRDAWKKAPWLPGSTIDLGAEEHEFADDVKHWIGDLATLPPAVLDRLRWKFRRLAGNSSRDEWLHFLRGEGRRIASELAELRGDLRSASEPSLNSLQTTTSLSPEVTAPIVAQSADALRSLLPLCGTKSERDHLVTALAKYCLSPEPENREAWLAWVRRLRAR